MDANTIESIVNEILYLMKTLNKDKLDTLFLDFRTKNRMLYETILKGEFDREIFKQMMKYKRRIENGEDQYSVDVKFGQFMADKYITPNVMDKQPSVMDKTL